MPLEMCMADKLQQRTIQDFGTQWQAYRDNAGFYGSLDLFWDYFGTLLGPAELQGCRVAEIGSGSGRIVKMLLAAGVDHVVALEPSAAFAVLRENTSDLGERVTCLQLTGDKLP